MTYRVPYLLGVLLIPAYWLLFPIFGVLVAVFFPIVFTMAAIFGKLTYTNTKD